MKTHLFSFSIMLIIILSMNCLTTFSQIDIQAKIKQKAEEKINKKVDEAIDKSLDEIEKSTKQSNDDNKEKDNSNTSNDEKKPETTSVSSQQKIESYSKYDFVPGDKILFYEDFSKDAIGDFPALWTTNGSGEVKNLNIATGNWFDLTGDNAVYCLIPEINFPSNFILEFDIVPDEKFDSYGILLTLFEERPIQELNDQLYPGTKGLHITLGTESWETFGYDDNTETNDFTGRTELSPVEIGKVNHVIIWIQNRRVRIYHKGNKVIDMPTNIVQGSQFNRLRFSCWDKQGRPFISNIKVTTASPDTRNKLLTEGKIISYGIYFDVNKDVVKSESFGTLNDLAKILKENPTLRIKIIGYTDADGVDATNLDLSKRRAANVKNELVKTFGIDASRIETDGLGENQPIAPNDSPSNKVLNRRVEFIRL